MQNTSTSKKTNPARKAITPAKKVVAPTTITYPAITLLADLKSVLAVTLEEGTAFVPGFLRITLCGFGPVLPNVPGVCMIADAGIPQYVGPQVDQDTPLSQQLWGNDAIVPAGTFYEIAVLDENRNVIQCGNYQFSGAGEFDLSYLPQILPPYGFSLGALQYLPCTGSGSSYTAPGKSVIAVTYNGILLVRGASLPTLSYTATGNAISLNFATQSGDRIDAFVVT